MGGKYVRERKKNSIKYIIEMNDIYILSILSFILIRYLNRDILKICLETISLSLLWIFTYSKRYDKTFSQDNFINILRVNSIALMFLFSFDISGLEIQNSQMIMLIILVINVCISIYVTTYDKGEIDKKISILLCLIPIVLDFTIRAAFGEIINVNFIVMMSGIMLAAFNIYNVYFLLDKQCIHYKATKSLTAMSTILTILGFLFSMRITIINNDLLKDILYILLYSHIYGSYSYSSKNSIIYPYIELFSRNEKLDKNSQHMNKINIAIQKDIIIQNKLKNYIEQREGLLRQALDNMPCILMITDHEFNIIYTNNYFKEEFNFKVDSFYEVIDLIDKGRIKNNNWKEKLNENKVYISTIQMNDRIYSLNITNNESDNSYLIALSDTTNEIKMGRQIQSINENYEKIILNTPYPVLVIKLNKDKSKSIVVSINRKFEGIFGFTLDEMKGITLEDYIDLLEVDFFDNNCYKRIKLDKNKKVGIISNLYESKSIVNLVVKDKYGNEYIEEVSIGNCFYGDDRFKLLTFRNVTSEVEIFKSINSEKVIYQKLIDSIPEATLLEDLETSKVIHSNKAFRTMFGIVDGVSEDICQKYRNKIMKKHVNNIHMGGEDKSIYLVNEKNDIKEIKLISKTLVFDNRIRKIRIIKDIGARKELEKIKTVLNRQRKYDKMKMEFYVNMSHELKTPLNNIYSSIQLIESLYRKNKISDKQGVIKNHIKITKQNMFRLLRLIENIINISQVKSEIYKIRSINFDIIDITERIVESISGYAKSKNIDLVFDTEEDVLNVGLDPESIERIILNLLSNAIKFTRDGGEILINIQKIDNYVEISIKDNGVGIEEEKLMDIFERFKQIENSDIHNEFGSGIGLFLTKSLVEIQNGKIDIKSEVNKGTEVIVSFPIKEVEEEVSEDTNYDDNIEKFEIEFFDIYK